METINQNVTYKNVTTMLNCQQQSLFPSELHGYMCGVICGGNYNKNGSGFRVILDMIEDEDMLSEDSKSIAAKLMLNTTHQLHDVNSDFKLFLPDDEHTIYMRGQALAAWCQNFLGGLGLSGINDKHLQQQDINEAILDVAEIAKLDCDSLTIADDYDEMEFVELVEYVRVAVLLIYSETLAGNRQHAEIRH